MKMFTKLFLIQLIVLLPLISFAQETSRVEELEKRIQKLERKSAMDRIEFTGDFRATADSIDATQAAYYNGMVIQKNMVDTMFMFSNVPMEQMPPFDDLLNMDVLGMVNGYISQNPLEYMLYKNGVNFADFKAGMGMMMQNFGLAPGTENYMKFMGHMMGGSFVPEQDYSNNIVYTSRLRLNMRAKVMDNIKFTGRLSMYKSWGDSTGVQVFNGQPNSFSIDGTNGGTPNSDILRVDRAYFDWSHLGGSNWYLSIGRRPSTEGPPLHLRQGELRQGTPSGHLVNFQFDGITVGSHYGDKGGVFRFCYGLGFESGIGSADQLKAPADRLKDVHMGGINWDIWNDDSMRIQTTIMGAMDITDGFNGLIVMPYDVVTGDVIPGPMIMRYTPSANLGDFLMASLMIEREETYFTWFASYAMSQSKPNEETTPFGGLLCDPFDVPEEQDGYSYYVGINAPLGSVNLGFEYNYGSQYWFNFTQGSDDLVASKLATRGSVTEFYLIKGFAQGLGRARAKLRFSAMLYDYEYSGSGWQVGAPKKLVDATPTTMMDVPMLGFPTYKDVMDIRAALIVKF